MKNKDTLNENHRKWREENPETYKNGKLVKKYGITYIEYCELLRSQNGVCAICKQLERSTNHITGKCKQLAVDHDHKTGEVRGLLCDLCNRGIGHFNDDPK